MSSVCSVDYLVAPLEILEEIFNKIWPEARNNPIQLASINNIFKKILTENALEYLASGEDLIMDRLTGSTSKRKSWK